MRAAPPPAASNPNRGTWETNMKSFSEAGPSHSGDSSGGYSGGCSGGCSGDARLARELAAWEEGGAGPFPPAAFLFMCVDELVAVVTAVVK